MGMAASQARYLALTARKTNTEYEGQQINQARTALANQSANLFNRLLNLDVPQPPSTTDYTKVQYSYSDGENASVIDEWKQLSGVNPDYNYIVKSHYFASMYTGALKQLTDPQVQIGGNGQPMNWTTIALNKQLLDTADDAQKTAYNNLQQIKSEEEIDILNIQTEAYINNSTNGSVDTGINRYEVIPNGYTLYNDETGASYTITTYTNPADASAQTILQGVRDMLDTNLISMDALNGYLVQIEPPILITEDNIDQITEQGAGNEIQQALLSVFGLEENNGTQRIVRMEDVNAIINDGDENVTTAHTHALNGIFLTDGVHDNNTLNYYASDIRDNHIERITQAENLYNEAYTNYQRLLENYNNTTRPIYIGNSELTPLVNLTDEQRIELLQVVKDMKAENIDTAILDCFDGDTYLGGIYSFQMNGTTYYTTQDVLEEAYYHSYPQNGSNNIIDAQYKMPYYNASYIDKRIEKESYALLETDGDGRFKTVRFEDDSIVYSLNTETVTDEAAYQDAMNRYVYEKEKYEKTIADINARTSIIQKEDRTLELRLKQLDTEQKSLSTEMDAVKKVIKDNIEATFKTFSD